MNTYEQTTQEVRDAFNALCKGRVETAVKDEREACHALRQTLPNPYDHCQVSAHAYDMAIAAYGSAIRARTINEH
tara:strand:+ start:1917 stop:2141 length:225 start_codon:yes stop_codon:yes gene_type:complete